MLNAKEMYEEFFRGDDTVTPFEALSLRTQDRWRTLAEACDEPKLPALLRDVESLQDVPGDTVEALRRNLQERVLAIRSAYT